MTWSLDMNTHKSEKVFSKYRTVISMRTLVIAACGLMPIVATPALADTASEISALKAQLKRLEAVVEKQKKEDKQAKNVNNAGKPAGKDVPPPVFVDLRKGLFLETEDHEYAFKLGGRIIVDGGGISQPLNGFSGNANFRQIRLETEGKMHSWFYKIQYDFASTTVGQFNANVETAAQQYVYNGSGVATTVNPYYRYYTDRNFLSQGIRDMFFGIQDKRLSSDYLEQPVHFRIGNQFEPFGLETQASSKYRDTIERPMMSDALQPSRHLGASMGLIGKNGWGANIGLYTISPEDMINQAPTSAGQYAQVGVLQYPSVNGNNKWYQSYGGAPYFDITSRITYSPIHDEHSLIHGGISGNYHQENSSTGWNDDRNMIVGNRIRSEANVLNQSLLGTPDLSCGSVSTLQGLPTSGAVAFNQSSASGGCVKNIEKIGFDVAASYYNWFVQAEYTGAWYNRNSYNVAQAALAQQNALGGGGAGNGLYLAPANNNLFFSGYYVTGEWWITGEEKSQSYDRTDKNGANFSQLKIKDKFSDGGWGAWGLVGRLSALNLNNGPYSGGGLYNMLTLASFCPNGNCASNPFLGSNGKNVGAWNGVTNSGVYGGAQTNATVGVNWYPDNGIAFQANATRVMNVSAPLNWNNLTSYSSGSHPTLFEVRTKVYF
jgi:phosphate-selective porin OprO and OprP